jgi:signal peptidase II
MSAQRRRAWLLALALVTIGCDRVTKHAASTALRGTPRRSYLADTVRLEYVENPGGFLSLGAQLPRRWRVLLFDFGTALILGGTLLLLARRRLPLPELAGVTLICAGGASNLLDRALRGSVVDFLNLGVGGLRTGIFNLADVAILAGVSLVVWRRSREARAEDA